MSNKPHNPKAIKEIFDSLPTLDPSRPDLRIINYDLLETIVAKAEHVASLQGSLQAYGEANTIVKDVLSKSFPSL